MKIHDRICTICDKEFKTKFPRQNTCSWECRRQKRRQRSRVLSFARRKGKPNEFMQSSPSKRVNCDKCVVCGYDETIDIHHEAGKEFTLCPNHHALITRGIKTLEELLQISEKNNYQHSA